MIWRRRFAGSSFWCSSPLGTFPAEIPCRTVNEGKSHLLLSAENTVAFFWHIPLLPKHTVLFPRLGDLALLIGLGSWFLWIVPIFLYPAALCRKPNAKIRRNLVAAQGAGKCKTNCFRAEFRGWFLRHVLSALWQNTKSMGCSNFGIGPK